MAQVPEQATIPNVQQQPGPSGRIAAPSLNDATAAGVLGQAAANLGKNAQEFSDVYAKHALELAQLNNQSMADTANQDFMEKAGRLTADFDEKVKNVNSQDADKLYSDHIAALEGLRQQSRLGLTNPVAQSMFDEQSRRMQGYMIMGSSRSVAAGVSAFRDKAFQSSVDGFTQDMALNSNDPQRQEFDRQSISNAAFNHYAIDLGLPPQTVQDAITQHLSAANSSVIEQKLRTDPVGAHQYLEDNKHEMTPAAYGEASLKVDAALNTHFTDKIANDVTASISQAAQHNPAVAAAAQPTGATPGLVPQMASAEHSILTDFPGARVTSEGRSPAHSVAVGGFSNDPHTQGRAVDLEPPPGMTRSQFAQAVQAKGYPGLTVVNEGPGAPHSSAPHVHVQVAASGDTAGSRLENMQSSAPELFARADAEAEAVAKQYGLDPDVLKQNVEQKLQSDFGRQDFIYRQQTDTVKSNLIQNILTGGPNGTPITSFTDFMKDPDNAAGYAQLNGQGQKMIQATIRGQLQQTSPIEKARIDGMKVTDPQGFLAMDPTQNRQLSPRDQAGILEEQVHLRGDLKKQADYHASLSTIDNNRLLNSGLQASGILDKNNKVVDQRGYDVYTGRMFQEINGWLGSHPEAKGHIPPEEVAKIGSRVIPQLGGAPGSEYDLWPGGPKIGTFGAKPGTGSAAIPDDAYNAIYRNFALRYGRNPEDWEIGQAYQQVLDARGRK